MEKRPTSDLNETDILEDVVSDKFDLNKMDSMKYGLDNNILRAFSYEPYIQKKFPHYGPNNQLFNSNKFKTPGYNYQIPHFGKSQYSPFQIIRTLASDYRGTSPYRIDNKFQQLLVFRDQWIQERSEDSGQQLRIQSGKGERHNCSNLYLIFILTFHE